MAEEVGNEGRNAGTSDGISEQADMVFPDGDL